MTKLISFCKTKTTLLFIFLPVLVLSTVFSPGASAQGNLMITPRRIVFEGQRKTQELNLANTGKDTARYLISMLEIRMNADGTFEQITAPDPGQNFASSYVRFFPRSVILGPGEVQTVKVQITKQSQMEPGEYRSHIYFRAIPPGLPLGEKEFTQDTAGISVRILPVFGISVPVIIRNGENTAAVGLSDMAFERTTDDMPVLNILFNRTGNMSVYGDIRIEFISTQGKVTRVGEIKGVAVYTPTVQRHVRVVLDKIPGIDYKTGRLHVMYSTPAEARAVKMAETELIL
jgi:hypothetical protein